MHEPTGPLKSRVSKKKFSATTFCGTDSRQNKLVKIILPNASRFSSFAPWTLAAAKKLI
jgi:hypothetical protein